MYNKFLDSIGFSLTSGTKRTLVLKKNILASFFLKVLGIILNLMLVPMTIRYVDVESYGIWLTISSIVGWFSFFDIGLNNGLRNHFAIAVAKKDTELARKLVSSAYAILALIFFAVWIVFIILNKYLDWSKILKVEENLSSTLSTMFVIVFTYFCIQFILRLVTTILIADQKPAKSALIDTIGQLASLLIIFILIQTTQGSLIYLSIALCLAPLVVLIIANLILFSTEYKQYRPSFSYVSKECSKKIFRLGAVFFVIQIAGLIHYQSANFIIARYIGMEEVTAYNITYKYFNVLYMVFAIILFPFWSAATDAYASNDFAWIKNAINKYLKVFPTCIILGIIMLVFSPIAYSIWLGDETVPIPLSLSFWCFLSIASIMFGSIFVNLLNGIGAIRIQFYSCMFSPILFLLLCWIFIKELHLGVHYLFIASILSNFNGIILAPLQYVKIFIQNKRGIWSK
jgi:Na+-driven multidrug efflux pump